LISVYADDIEETWGIGIFFLCDLCVLSEAGGKKIIEITR